ncbi:MAG: hypothetical protein ACTHN0_06880 [Aquihabitans sp.]
MSARRGPYRKPTRRTVKDPAWWIGDVVQVGGTRWIIRSIRGDDVVLRASNTSNHKVRWTTTLDRLPRKEPRA